MNPCDDNDPCTNDTCIAGNCSHSSRCADGLYCTENVCIANVNGSGTMVAECVFPERVCDIGLNETERKCYKAACSETKQCFKTVDMRTVNVCGECMAKINQTDRTDTSCINGFSVPITAGLAAGAVAAIVVGAVIGFAIFSAAGAFGTYKLVALAKAAEGMTAHNNPMYAPSDSETINPAYGQQQ